MALDDYLEIYQIRKDVLESRAEILKDSRIMHEMAPVFPPVQQLSLRGRFQKLFVFAPTENQLMIVALMNYSKLYGKLR